MRSLTRLASTVFAAFLLAACALPVGDPLRVTVAGVEPLPSEGLEWRMLVRLRVQNPNDSAIEYDGVSLRFDVMDGNIASGVSDERGTIPRFGEAVVAVPVTVSLVDVVTRAMRMGGDKPPQALRYRLEGKLHGPLFGSVPFASSGEVALGTENRYN
jgi:LEA14-like dessication related protein